MRPSTQMLGLGALVLMGRISPVLAQSDEERASARAAAQQGIQALKAGRYTEAVDLIGRAESVVHAPTHLLYLARAYAKLGKLVRAREVYLKLTREDLAPGASKPFRDAKADGIKELAALEPELAFVTIVVEGAAAASARVVADDTAVPAALVGISQPADPGTHKYQATTDKAASEVVSTQLASGAHTTVTLVLRETAVAAAEPSAATPSAVPSGGGADIGTSSSRTSGLRMASYVSLGVGAVGLIAGGYFLARRAGKEDDSNALFDQCNPRFCTTDERAQVAALDDQANSATGAATVGFVVGGVAAAAGVTMLVLDLSRGTPATSARVYPWIGPRGAGLSGSF